MIGASRMFDAGGIPLFTSWSFLGALRSSCRQYIVPVITSNDLSWRAWFTYIAAVCKSVVVSLCVQCPWFLRQCSLLLLSIMASGSIHCLPSAVSLWFM